METASGRTDSAVEELPTAQKNTRIGSCKARPIDGGHDVISPVAETVSTRSLCDVSAAGDGPLPLELMAAEIKTELLEDS
jgi:hypothetical protein